MSYDGHVKATACNKFVIDTCKERYTFMTEIATKKDLPELKQKLLCIRYITLVHSN